MKKILIPKNSSFIPRQKNREFHKNRNINYTADKFNSYIDWFYFIHIDPYARRIHAFGMVIGTFLYFICAYKIWIFGFSIEIIIQIFLAAFFFFYLPLISHYIYDGGKAKSTPDMFLPTLIPVIHINLLTISGRYDKWLRKFILKYPFTIEAWGLEEKEI